MSPTPPLPDQSDGVEIVAFVCPECWKVGSEDERCGHYVSGSAGWAYMDRIPVRLVARRVALDQERLSEMARNSDVPAAIPVDSDEARRQARDDDTDGMICT